MAAMELTLLNNMAGTDLPAALDRYVGLGLRLVDLKDGIWGRKVEELDDEQSARVAALVVERGLAVHCLSTALGWTDVNVGETAWRAGQEQLLDRVLRVAAIVRPRYVRVLAVRIGTADHPRRSSYPETVAAQPWVPAAFADMVRRINAAGFSACIENEARHCALATPEDVVAFLGPLLSAAGAGRCDYVLDVQNMWQMGTFPTVAMLEKLRPYLRLLHLKGGRADAQGNLAMASSLRTASWPVWQLMAEVHRTGNIDVICLNPSHGKRPADYDVWRVVQDDVAFLREVFLKLASGAPLVAG